MNFVALKAWRQQYEACPKNIWSYFLAIVPSVTLLRHFSFWVWTCSSTSPRTDTSFGYLSAAWDYGHSVWCNYRLLREALVLHVLIRNTQAFRKTHMWQVERKTREKRTWILRMVKTVFERRPWDVRKFLSGLATIRWARILWFVQKVT
jgi:hypothetical protein